jgi:uncharacterized membrane protein
LEKSKIMKIKYIIVSLITFAAAGCYYDKEELLYPGTGTPANCNTVPAKFGTDVSPIISTQCATAGCHNGTAAGGLVLQTHAQISTAKDIIKQRAVVEKSMPPSGPLTPAQVNVLQCWIDAGAPNN